jgi:Zn finger protein HypA/HybF involved in hydrogenase expression
MQHLVFWTFIFQTIAFIAVFAAALFFVVREFFGGKSVGKTAAKKTKENHSDTELPRLKPLNCVSCGAGLALQIGEMICESCGIKNDVPADYEKIFSLRKDVLRRLTKAESYWRWSHFLTSALVRILIAAVAIWLIISFVLLLAWETSVEFQAYQNWFKSGVFAETVLFTGIFSNFIWVFALLFLAASLQKKVRKILPEIVEKEIKDETNAANCPQCGGAIIYENQSLSTVCGYCGIENFRVKFAWKVKNLTNEKRKTATFSLIEAMQNFEDTVFEMLFIPSFLVILLTVGFIGIMLFNFFK